MERVITRNNHKLPKELFPTPWRQFRYYSKSNYQIQVEETHQQCDQLKFQIDKLKKRYSKPQGRKRIKSETEPKEIVIDVQSVESKLLSGNRFQFNNKLEIDYIQVKGSKICLHSSCKQIRIGQFSVSEDIALRTQRKKFNSDLSTSYALRKFEEIDDLVERVRLQQVEILKQCNAKDFSKEIQQKLKNEMFVILKSFQ